MAVPLCEKLETSGINVTVINSGMYKKPDDKTDPHDSSWIHLYHSVDLFRKSHFAPEQWRDLRGYIHERDVIMRQKVVTLTRINRQLEMMNCKLPDAVSDIEGAGQTGCFFEFKPVQSLKRRPGGIPERQLSSLFSKCSERKVGGV
ncbi:MAG: hypothetical protein LBK58_10880 [Prevotellaceae bacterium]|jgi:hypothetical protein|nr:hypothetical protein [Prevotellaceae bacterium]